MKRLRLNSGQATLAFAVLMLTILVVYPLAQLVYQSIQYNQQWSLQSYLAAITSESNLLALRHSLEVSIAAMLGATILGTFLAWLIARTDLPGRNFFRTAFVLPFLIPPFIGALAWLQILGPVGYLNKFFMALTGASEPLWNIYGPTGIVLVMILHEYPTVFISVLGGLERMNPELEEAAQISGSRIFRVMRDITLPLMMPTIAAGALLVFITDIANFGVPAILGFSENYYVLTTQIYNVITRSTQPNSLNIAAAMSILLALVSGVGIFLQRFYLSQKEYAVISGKSMQPNVVRLGAHRYWLFALAAVIVLVAVIAPLVAILLTALVRAYGLPPLPENLTLQNFYDVLLLNQSSRRGIINSLGLAVAAATIISILSAFIAYIIVKTKMRGRALLDFISNAPYTLPGTVVALAMILAWLKPLPLIDFRLYNTIWILLVAYVARYLAFGVRTAAGSLAQVHASLEEAARISGAGWLQSFRDIVIPLIRPGLFAGWFLVFIPCLRELTISALLWSTRNETIGVVVFNLQQSGNTSASAALAAIMIGVLLLANVITRRLTGGKLGY
ncbi:MAG: iron ABC transporter permease [Anaerolineales bacterium]|nr:iron ABC transporter permease [Anaerolineales bacterium]